MKPREIQPVLADIVIAEAWLQEHRMPSDTSRIVMQKYYEEIFHRHNVDRKEFYESMEFYITHPALLEKAFIPIIDSLSTLEARIAND